MLIAAVLVTVVAVSGMHVAAAAAPVSPALLYVFAGQSNMVGAATNTAELYKIDPTLHASPSNVRFWGPTEDTPKQWGPIEPPTEVRNTISHMGFGPEISAAPLLSRLHPNASIGIVKLAVGGTNLFDQWNPRNPIGLYPQLIAEVRAAKSQFAAMTQAPVRIAGFFWMQGESDTMTKPIAKAYGRNLTALIDAARMDLDSPHMPFVIGEIPEFKQWYRGFPYCSIVQAQERYVAKHVSSAYYVPTEGLERAPSSPIHFSTRGTVDLGRRFVSAKFGL
jgi:hypothetical protein